jgi:hypothetical protein
MGYRLFFEANYQISNKENHDDKRYKKPRKLQQHRKRRKKVEVRTYQAPRKHTRTRGLWSTTRGLW